jgi:8-oxo-dGTP pyrophosphatase MutT (NUDIX family)
VENPWKTLSSREIYKNPWIRVREDQVLRPSGEPGIYSVVEARLAVGVIALSDHDEIMLIGQYRYPTQHYSWEIVEGGAETGESALDTAKRELLEESGLVANYFELLGSKCELSNCHSNERAIFFLARGLTQGAAQPDPTEKLQTCWKPASECLALLEQGYFTDVMTLLALYRFRARFVR